MSRITTTIAALSLGLAMTAAAQQSGTYPSNGAPVASGKPHTFTIRIENVSTDKTLKLSNGQTAPAPNAPVLWVISTMPDPFFTAGKVDRGQGLEALAEDGNPSVLAGALKGQPGIASVGFVNKPVGSILPGPATPGKAYEFTVTAEPGQKLYIASMFGQSNDLFFGTNGNGIYLFDSKGDPQSGDMTTQLMLWDAGTEVNEEPGLGPNQAPRQSGANTGTAEKKTVSLVSDKYKYPKVTEVIKLTVTPSSTLSSGN